MKTYQYVTTTTDRHDTVVRYFKRKGQRKIRLRAEPGTVEFEQEYQAARDGLTAPRDATPPTIHAAAKSPAVRRAPKADGDEDLEDKSLRWLVDQYFASAYFTTLKPTNKGAREADLLTVCNSIHRKSGLPRGELRFRSLRSPAVVEIRDMTTAPGVGNRLIVSLSAVFGWAKSPEAGFAFFNPCSGVDRREADNGDEGYWEWTKAACAAFERRWPVGTMQRLAYEIAMFTALRRSDIRRVGPQYVNDDGWFDMIEAKGAHSKFIRKLSRPKTKTINKPVAEGLQDVIDATPGTGDESWIVNKWGRTFANVSFGHWFKKAIRAAAGNDPKLAEFAERANFHGIRKRSTADLSDLPGTSLVDLQSHGNWTGFKNPSKYARGADMRAAAIRGAAAMDSTRQGKGIGRVVAFPGKRKESA